MISLLITVRDRQENIPLLCDYYSDLTCRKIIVDASKSQLASVPDGFQYVYAGAYDPLQYFSTMWQVARDCCVGSQYIVECPDDDVILKQSILQSANFLDANKDYVACDGEYVIWKPTVEREVYPKPNFISAYTKQVEDDFHSTNAKERIEYQLYNWVSINHSVMRRQLYMHAYQMMSSIPEIKSITFFERIFTIVAAHLGNIKRLRVPHMIRDYEGSLTDLPEYRSALRLDYKMRENLREDVFNPVSQWLTGTHEYSSFLVATLRRYFEYYSNTEHTYKDFDWAFYDDINKSSVEGASKVFRARK